MPADDLPLDVRSDKGKPCPICRRPSLAASAPFCSKRCADIDLHRWLGGVYAVPAEESGSSDEEDGA